MDRAHGTKEEKQEKHKKFSQKHASIKKSVDCRTALTLRLLMSYIYGAPSKARNANVGYIWTYVWQR